MGVQEQMDRLKADIDSAYAAVREKGGEVPEKGGSVNLAEAVRTIPGAGNTGPVQWSDINGRPDLSHVSSMKTAPVVLSHLLWDESNQLTVPVEGVLADEEQQLVIAKPKRASRSVYHSCGIELVDQEENFLTFECKTMPDKDVSVNVFMFGAAEVGEEYVGKFEWWSPEMTSNRTPPPYSASSSSELSEDSQAWVAFNTDTSDYWHTAGSDPDPWISFDFGNKATIKGLFIRARVSREPYMPSHGTVYGSDDGEKWNVITSFSDWVRVDDGRTEEILFEKPVSYRYYRIGKMDHGYVSFAEIQFYR